MTTQDISAFKERSQIDVPIIMLSIMISTLLSRSPVTPYSGVFVFLGVIILLVHSVSWNVHKVQIEHIGVPGIVLTYLKIVVLFGVVFSIPSVPTVAPWIYAAYFMLLFMYTIVYCLHGVEIRSNNQNKYNSLDMMRMIPIIIVFVLLVLVVLFQPPIFLTAIVHAISYVAIFHLMNKIEFEAE